MLRPKQTYSAVDDSVLSVEARESTTLLFTVCDGRPTPSWDNDVCINNCRLTDHCASLWSNFRFQADYPRAYEPPHYLNKRGCKCPWLPIVYMTTEYAGHFWSTQVPSLQFSPTIVALFTWATLVTHPSNQLADKSTLLYAAQSRTCRAASLATFRLFLSLSQITSGEKMTQASLLFWSACIMPRYAAKSSEHSIPVSRPSLIRSETTDPEIAARTAIEDEYARKLLTLARKPLGSSEAGTLRMSLDVIRGEVESIAKAHQNIAAQLKSELDEPLGAFAGGMKERRKIVQGGIEKLLKTKTQQTMTVNKVSTTAPYLNPGA